MKNKIMSSFALIAVAALALSGCAEEDGLDGAASETIVTDEETIEIESSNDSDDEAAESVLDSQTCLLGNWQAPEAQLQKFYDDIDVEGVTFTVNGGMGATFTDEDYEFQPDFSLNLEITGIEAEGKITGEVEGTYEASDEILTTVYESSNTVELTVSVMGQEHDVSGLTDSFLSMFVINDIPYTCTDSVLTLVYKDGSGEPTIPIEFNRK